MARIKKTQIKKINKLLLENKTNVEIACICGITTATVCYWKKKLGFKINRKKTNWGIIRQDHDDGMSFRDLANKHDISVSGIEYAVSKGIFNVVRRPLKSEEHKRGIKREAWARYNARKKFQTPADEDPKMLQEFYTNCPKGYHVDHVIPISKGGKHSISNVQYLTAKENLKKSNKLI